MSKKAVQHTVVRGGGGEATATPWAGRPAGTQVVVGAGGVGKSSVTVSFLHNKFLKDYDPTIEESYRQKITVDSKPVILDIIDTAGQEEYSSLRDQYLTQGEAFILIYSVTDRSSFEDAKSLRVRIQRVKNASAVPLLLVGNKSDLNEYREVTTAEGRRLAASFGVPFLETSAKTRDNIEEVFSVIVRELRKSLGQTDDSGCCVLL